MIASDLIGLSIFLFVVLCGLYGLYRISKPVAYTQEEYEKRLKEGTGIARGTFNAAMYPLQELLNPKAVEAIQVERDMKAGYYDVKQTNGDLLDEHKLDLPQPELKAASDVTNREKRVSPLRRFLDLFRTRR
jgi:hypothetical protein